MEYMHPYGLGQSSAAHVDDAPEQDLAAVIAARHSALTVWQPRVGLGDLHWVLLSPSCTQIWSGWQAAQGPVTCFPPSI
jgi:hypothetical protein